jgi:hypothetical protein
VGAFEDLHVDRVTGSLAMFDQMIFKGHLSALYKQDGARCFLWTPGVALVDFTAYAKATTERIANNAREVRDRRRDGPPAVNGADITSDRASRPPRVVADTG